MSYRHSFSSTTTKSNLNHLNLKVDAIYCKNIPQTGTVIHNLYIKSSFKLQKQNSLTLFKIFFRQKLTAIQNKKNLQRALLHYH